MNIRQFIGGSRPGSGGGGTDSGNKEKLTAAIFFYILLFRAQGGPGPVGPPLDLPMVWPAMRTPSLANHKKHPSLVHGKSQKTPIIDAKHAQPTSPIISKKMGRFEGKLPVHFVP